MLGLDGDVGRGHRGTRQHSDHGRDILEVFAATAEVGCAIIGQSGSIAPADGRIYALRDVTATVDSVPLITASIMSKKLAAGPETIVIDLKTGSGAFMDDIDRARDLAASLVAVGKSHGRNMSVVFSDMDQPLGVAVGHANETIEAFAALRPDGRGKAPEDLVVLTEELVAEYDHALGLVFCSLYEGFGLPIVEAMQHGCPVLCSRGTALAEVAGDAGLLVDPREPGEIEQGMRALATDRGLRERLSRAGRARAGRFTWVECARRTVDALQELGA